MSCVRGEVHHRVGSALVGRISKTQQMAKLMPDYRQQLLRLIEQLKVQDHVALQDTTLLLRTSHSVQVRHPQHVPRKTGLGVRRIASPHLPLPSQGRMAVFQWLVRPGSCPQLDARRARSFPLLRRLGHQAQCAIEALRWHVRFDTIFNEQDDLVPALSFLAEEDTLIKLGTRISMALTCRDHEQK